MRRPALASLGLGALLLTAAASAARDHVYAVVGARILPVSGPTLEKGTILLRGGVIEAVGPALPLPPAARVIDGTGWTLTPGLIDAFGGVGLPPEHAGPSGNPTPSPSPRPESPEARALDAVRPSEALKARDGGITTALTIPRDGVLPGQSVLLNLSGETADAMALKPTAALHLQMTSTRGRYPTSLMGTVALARQSLCNALHYRDERAAYDRRPKGRERPRYDAGLEAWQAVLEGRETLMVTAYRANDLRRAFTLADEFHVRIAIAGAPQAHRLSALLKARRVPLLITVNADPPRATSAFRDEDEEKERADIAEAETNPGELFKAGVPFALVSGHSPDFLAGVRRVVERGLPADAALKALTLGAAQALGIDDRTGSLEPGKIANVVAWFGDPLSKDARVKMVFVDGEPYEPEDRPKDKKDARDGPGGPGQEGQP